MDNDQKQAIAHAEGVLAGFSPIFEDAFLSGMRKKLGLFTAANDDAELVRDFLGILAAGEADFTLAFRRLCDAAQDPAADESLRSLCANEDLYNDWAVRWRQRLGQEGGDASRRSALMRAANPAFIARNHRVEAVINAAVQRDDFAPFEELLAVLAKPFEDQPGFSHYMDPPKAHERVTQTFCGT